MTILIALFFYLFVAEAFSDQFDISNFLMGLVPGTIILLTLLLSWKWENFGILFILYGAGYLALSISKNFNWIVTIIFSVPLIFVGILFTLYYFGSSKKRIRKKQSR